MLNGQKFTINDIAYEIVSNESVQVISKSPKYTGDIIIPSTVVYNGSIYVVKYIDSSAFALCPNLISVSIPNWVTHISNNAFSFSTALKSVSIGYSVQSIGTRAFAGCSTLSTVEFVGAVKAIKTIGDYVFENCTSLTSIELPVSITSIGVGAFYNCSALIEITIPPYVNEIKNDTFSNCHDLSTLKISNSVVSIGDNAFGFCTSLTNLDLNNVETIGKGAFYYCISLNSITIPNSVLTIADWAFRGSASSSVYIGNSVEHIGDRAFQGISNLEYFDVSTLNNSFSDYQGVLYDKEQNILIQCPAEKSSIEIPNTVSTIGAYSLSFCSKLNEIIIPNTVTYIGNYALADCYNLAVISCNAETPPSLGLNVFEGVNKSIPLNVPTASNGAYLAALQWNDFTINPVVTNLPEKRLSRIQVIHSSNMVTLHVEDRKVNDKIFIYNTSGILVYNQALPTSIHTIDLKPLKNGLYFLSVSNGQENFVFKILK